MAATIAFSLEVNGVAEVDRFFEAEEDRVQDLSGAWPATDAVFSDILSKQFKTEGAHGGPGWRPLSPTTVEAREKRLGHYRQQPVGGAGTEHPILLWTGRLRDSFIEREHPDAISERGRLRWARGSKVEYARAHQSGSKNRRLPQRRIIELNERDRNRIMHPVRNWVTGHDPWAGSGVSRIGDLF